MPNNFDYPSHVLLNETINENKIFKNKLSDVIRTNPVFSKGKYFEILQHKVAYIDIWETCYLQQLAGDNAVLEWVKGTALVPIKNTLSKNEYEEFTNCYNEKLVKVYSPNKDGITLFPFKRIFIIAVKEK